MFEDGMGAAGRRKDNTIQQHLPSSSGTGIFSPGGGRGRRVDGLVNKTLTVRRQKCTTGRQQKASTRCGAVRRRTSSDKRPDNERGGETRRNRKHQHKSKNGDKATNTACHALVESKKRNTTISNKTMTTSTTTTATTTIYVQ